MSLLERSHGANPEKLYQAMGFPMPERILDFSTNTNALPWEGDLSIDLRRCLASYPDDEATELRRTIAEHERPFVEDCSSENVLVVNGSNEAVYLIASFLGGKKAALWQPVYGEYARALSAYGAKVQGVFNGVFNAENLPNLPEGTEAFFLCNPCNPTGGYVEREALENLLQRYPHTLFVVDEAYADFLRGEHRRLDFVRNQNLIVLRSLTKIFHLCGARVGYVLACEARIARLKARQPTWSVNAIAQAATLTFMQDKEFTRKTRNFYAAETPRFIAKIEKAGFLVLPTRTHFFLIQVDEDRPLIVFLLKRGLVVRHTRNFPGLDGRYIRVSTRAPEENDILIRALSDFNNHNRNRAD
ncbi:MAG: pyridoxal phosphate-dependent class II aminotransferase [Synergistaceae bacterium]|jgi:threonine-phosphate decarboxylase|nr:pyridoxal phosphate-dependent class II aminotransferase [Synergistaceae bacterium]